jgi:hypothetical protein
METLIGLKGIMFSLRVEMCVSVLHVRAKSIISRKLFWYALEFIIACISCMRSAIKSLALTFFKCGCYERIANELRWKCWALKAHLVLLVSRWRELPTDELQSQQQSFCLAKSVRSKRMKRDSTNARHSVSSADIPSAEFLTDQMHSDLPTASKSISLEAVSMESEQETDSEVGTFGNS